MKAAANPDAVETRSPWAPLRTRTFAVVWTASLTGAMGTWMRDVGAGWLMTSLSPSVTYVALVQVATSLPIFLLSLPAGALADIVDRRRSLLWLNALLAAVACFMGVVAASGGMTPVLLVGSLLLAGVFAALVQPMQQSLTPLLVPRAQLRTAVALNGLGFNVARATGPAIAGVLIAVSGVAITFFLDALSYAVLFGAFWWWKGASARASSGPPESLLPAMRAGIRYALHSVPLQRTLLRAASFFIYASALWALLPVIARRQLGGGPGYYGVLLACVGAGAVVGAVALPKLRSKIGSEGVMRLGMAAAAGVLLTLAFVKNPLIAAVAMALAGAAWIAVLTTVNVSAQTALPDWVRGRGLAVYLTVFYGAMSIGSLLWGAVADAASVAVSLSMATLTGMLSLVLGFLKPLPAGEADLTPSMHWPDPTVAPAMLTSLEADRGPVLITVEYLVSPGDIEAFLAAVREFKSERLRDGAFLWGIYEDTDRPGRFLEHFLVASWLEHQRQHRRVSMADADLQALVVRFHRGTERPRVEHLIAPPH
nr:MFS transporter [Piscinibacter sp. XHJ-5]